MPTLGRALPEALRDHGAQEISGIPGAFVLPLFNVVEESGLFPFHTFSHEPAVGFAADSASRFRDPRPVLLDQGQVASRANLRHAGALRGRLQGGAGTPAQGRTY